MRKKFLLCLAALLALWGIGTTAAAAPVPGLGSYLQVTGYDPQTDYMDAMERALQDGSAYALQVGAIYEQQRNLKIETLQLDIPTTSYFTDYTTAAEILAAIERDRQPEPSYTQADLDLLSRLIYAEAGCTWIPDWVQQMVGSVVLNRVESEYYPDTIREVIYQPGQYAPTWDGS